VIDPNSNDTALIALAGITTKDVCSSADFLVADVETNQIVAAESGMFGTQWEIMGNCIVDLRLQLKFL